MELVRSSGILLPIASLPSRYGIGTLGKEAYAFIDFLAKAGQKYWQILPAGPLSYGDSPYQSLSTFAGNPYFIDLDLLIEAGLLEKSEVEAYEWGDDPSHIDYGKIYNARFEVLRKAANRGLSGDAAEFSKFAAENAGWLDDYALFMAVKRHFNMRPWIEWPDEGIRLHSEEACDSYREELKEDYVLFQYIQYLFYQQWELLRAYAGKNHVDIIGDIPIYVAFDSADVWAEPQWFQLDEENHPTDVAGVPPDYFNEDGQLWGNPLYRWDAMEQDGFDWWIRRVEGAFRLYDMVRFDHFRGLESYWAVPYGDSTAKNGKWVKGPGMKLVSVLKHWFKDNAFIAEDLGLMTPEVKQLLSDSGFPGMKVLEFAFNAQEPSDYLPHMYSGNCICYTGTHDNATLTDWLEDMGAEDLAYMVRYLGLSKAERLDWGVIRGGMSSVANLFIAQMQDYLGLGKEARINTPGTPTGNWAWRMEKKLATDELAEKIAAMTKLYGRQVIAAKKEK